MTSQGPRVDVVEKFLQGKMCDWFPNMMWRGAFNEKREKLGVEREEEEGLVFENQKGLNSLDLFSFFFPLDGIRFGGSEEGRVRYGKTMGKSQIFFPPFLSPSLLVFSEKRKPRKGDRKSVV